MGHSLASMPESPPPAPAPTTMWICRAHKVSCDHSISLFQV
jgi:hypothetical protein